MKSFLSGYFGAGDQQVKDPRITNLLCRLLGEEEVSQQLVPPTVRLRLFPEWDEAFAPQGAEICSVLPPQCPCPVWPCQMSRATTKPQESSGDSDAFSWS